MANSGIHKIHPKGENHLSNHILQKKYPTSQSENSRV